MAKKSPLKSSTKTIEALTHDEAKRKNIPTAEYQSVLQKEEEKPKTIKYPRNTDLDVKAGNAGNITREPEQVKAFRDTWRDGIHSYLTYLRDRLTVARDLLTESGSIFVQIGDENVHRVRALVEEVFGENNFCGLITLTKAASQSSGLLASINDFLLWFARDRDRAKYRPLLKEKRPIE